MPNIKSQKDRVLQSKKENLRNKAVKSNLKTVIKKADIALADGSADAQKAVVDAVSTGINPQVRINNMYYDMNKIQAVYGN